MAYPTCFKRASEMTNLEIGDSIVSASGVELFITNITLGGLYLNHPTIMVSYDYNDNGQKGSETVSYTNFYNNVHS